MAIGKHFEISEIARWSSVQFSSNFQTCFEIVQTSKMEVKVGIIGGSGFYKMPELKNPVYKTVQTEFGEPSDQVVEGVIEGVPVVLIAR